MMLSIEASLNLSSSTCQENINLNNINENLSQRIEKQDSELSNQLVPIYSNLCGLLQARFKPHETSLTSYM